MIHASLPFLLLSLVSSALVLPGGEDHVLREDFDARGSEWSATALPELFRLPGAQARREFLTVALGAPATFPALPIAAGGDAEGRFFEQGGTGGQAIALTALRAENVFRDGSARVIVAFGNPTNTGSSSVSLLLRARRTPGAASLPIDAYGASLGRDSVGGHNGIFALVRYRNGVITGDDVLASSVLVMPPREENYVIEFSTSGTLLRARLWRLTVSEGRLHSEPVFLPEAAKGGNELVARDATYLSGRAGLDAFCRGPNSVFVDDLLVKPVPPERFPR